MRTANDLGFVKNIDVLKQLVDIRNKRVVDAGCGNLTFSKILVELGAHVLAIDPDPVQAEKNREAKIDRLKFVETGADRIPVDDKTMDGVFFSYSLHHVPAEIYPAVFDEVNRILKDDGFLYVLEPTDCPLNQVMRLFHDEDLEREAAQQAIEKIAVPQFSEVKIVTYHDFRKYESFDDFATTFAGKSFNSLYSEADVRTPQVEAEFNRLGGPGFEFASPKKVVLMEGLRR